MLTNEHVAKFVSKAKLTHSLGSCGSVFHLNNHPIVVPDPIDIALIEINMNTWDSCTHESLPMPEEFFTAKHQPTKDELLFTLGFAGDRSGFHFGHMLSGGTPYLTQETELVGEVGDSCYHFAVPYKPDQAISMENTAKSQPNPPGLSGSLVWNTRFIEYI